MHRYAATRARLMGLCETLVVTEALEADHHVNLTADGSLRTVGFLVNERVALKDLYPLLNPAPQAHAATS